MERRKIVEVVALEEGKSIVFETGYVGLQANGSVFAKIGDTVAFVAAVMSKEPRLDIDFFPLLVEYEEKQYAVGKIPGGFFKREGKPSEAEILRARLIDRSIRPLFPEEMRNDVEVIAMILASDSKNPPEIAAMNGASAALYISDIPFNHPFGAVRVGLIDGKFVVNPTFEELEVSDLDLVVAGIEDGIVMVEAGAREVSEDIMIEAMKFAHVYIKKIIEGIKRLREKAGKEKAEVPLVEIPDDLKEFIMSYKDEILSALLETEKKAREKKVSEIKNKVKEAVLEKWAENEEYQKVFDLAFKEVEKKIVRKYMKETGKRVDGRTFKEIRPLSAEKGILPVVHGSGLFTRGQTQVLSIATLGSFSDVQIIDSISVQEEFKRFIHHYDFTPFSTGDIKPRRGPSRREIGHGALAERALKYLIPPEEEFPYTIRVVSEVMESNGSTSMASVCASSIALMDAGVPMPKHVGGIAMGLIKEDDDFIILTDIQGLEDHLGDMDFKVAGTRDGITALQLDIKVKGITFEIMRQALYQAKEARYQILDLLYSAIEKPDELPETADKIYYMQVPVEKIGEIIGPGGRVIKKIIADAGVEIDINDEDGKVFIKGKEMSNIERAKEIIESIIRELHEGDVVNGKVTRIDPKLGIFLEIAPGKEGLLRVDDISPNRLISASDFAKIGDTIKVIVKNIDAMGRINFTRRGLDEWKMEEEEARKSGNLRVPRQRNFHGRRNDGRRDHRGHRDSGGGNRGGGR